MPIVSRFPTGNATVSGAWGNGLQGLNVDNGIHANFTTTTKNDVRSLTVGAFAFDAAIPAGATINSVSIEVEEQMTSGGTLRTVIIVGGVDGTLNDNTTDTTLTVRTYSSLTRPGGGSWTRDDLLNGTLTARFEGRQPNNTTSRTYEADYLTVIVDYSTEVIYEKAGAAVSESVASSVDAYEATETGQATSSTFTAAADVAEFTETGLVVMGEIPGGGPVTYEKTGLAASALSAAAADAAEFAETGAGVSATSIVAADVYEAVETGAGVSAAVASGTSSAAATHEKTGLAASQGIAAGVDAYTASDTGLVVSAASAAGESAVGGGTTFTKSGSVASAASLAGADAYEAIRTGMPTSVSSVAGADVFAADRTGAVLAVGFAAALDVFEAVETGAVVTIALLVGFSEGAAVIITYRFDDPSPEGGAPPGSPAGTHFDPPTPLRVLA